MLESVKKKFAITFVIVFFVSLMVFGFWASARKPSTSEEIYYKVKSHGFVGDVFYTVETTPLDNDKLSDIEYFLDITVVVRYRVEWREFNILINGGEPIPIYMAKYEDISSTYTVFIIKGSDIRHPNIEESG